MTKATIELIDQLCGIIDKSKYLILSGTMAVGKTYLANLIAEKSCEAKYCSQGIFNKGGTYEIETELISIHPSFYYEDFVNGIIIDTESGNINFHYADKVFLTLLKKANKSWEKKEDKKYFLILDDISRGAISGILGDMLPLIEPHGQTTYKTVLSDGETISVSPNVYIIATRSTLIDSVEQMNYGFLRHFYEYQLNNDYMYMCDSATDVYSDYDMSANAMFYRTKRIVTDYLRHRYQMSSVEKERYVIGHGMYKDTGTAMIARNQIIPLLRQYVKDNVLAKTANVSIAALQKLVDGQYSKDRTLADVNRIVLQKTGITADSFRSEGLTHQPLVNLVSRIKEQGLVDDTDIANDIMFNPQVVVRKKAKLDKVERDFPTPGYLYIEKSNRDIYTYGTTKNKSGATKRPRFFYSGSVNDAVSVDGIDYAIASEMQPGEYSRWYEELDVRAYLKKAGIGSYDSKEPGIKLSQYDDKTAVLRGRTKDYSKYIAGNIKPDIIIYNDENDNYLVFDVKYKNPLNSRSSRPDRLQILAYALMLNCKNVGNIFPTQDGTSNTYFKRNEINSREERPRYYNQINVAIDTEWEFTIQEEGGTSTTTILEYCKRLLM